MKKLLIHIGTGKTGTTSIQHSLLAAQRARKLGRVCYPDLLPKKWTFSNPHGILAYLYRPNNPPRIFKAPDREARLKSLLPDFRRELDRTLAGKGSVVLSTEFLAGLGKEELERFGKDLQPYAFGEIAVVIYVRHPADMYLSLTQQVLRASSVIRDPAVFRYRFRRAITAWGEAFGARIVVRPFDRPALHRGCVVQDFLKIASEFFGQELGEVPVVESNESLSAEACAVLQEYRRAVHPGKDDIHMPDSTRLARALRAAGASLPQTRPRLKQSVRNLVMKNHRKDLDWLRERHGIEFPAGADAGGELWASPKRAIEVADIMEFDAAAARSLAYQALHAVLLERDEAGN